MKIIGIDPGTKSFDLFGVAFDNNKEKIFLDKTIPSEFVAKNPEILLDEIKNYFPVDAIVGPSGYGLPLTKLADCTEKMLEQMLPLEGEDTGGVSVNEGIKRLFFKMKAMKLPVYFTPGVIHLPTVPEYRKLNRLDMGTADKVCVVALAMKDQMERLQLRAGLTSFILLEMGFGFTAAISVIRGQIVDGLGGTSGFPGFLGTGHLDGELAIRIGRQRQGVLFTGGVQSLTKNPIKDINEIAKHKQILSLLIESALKDIACLLVTNLNPYEIIISGRLSRVPAIYEHLMRQLYRRFPKIAKHRLQRKAKVAKEAAEGAVILGAGILGVKYTDIFKVMAIAKSKGTMYDYIRLKIEAEK
ncbi:MAG: DUF1464 family protein [candidate division WOR-3 bacterium]|nr:DUF1464 family protein [candidate division WOR-3 bacterium]